jgi:hypothetical protein
MARMASFQCETQYRIEKSARLYSASKFGFKRHLRNIGATTAHTYMERILRYRRMSGTKVTSTEITPSDAIAKINFFIVSPRNKSTTVSASPSLYTLMQNRRRSSRLAAILCSVIHYSFCRSGT